MHANCPYCTEPAPLKFRTKDRNRAISNEQFSYYSCPDCSLIFLSPIPKNLGDYYSEQYYLLPTSLRELAQSAEAERYKIDLVKQFATQGRLLEIGPATGAFAYLAKEAGFEVETIEMNERCCKFIREVINIPAIQSDDIVSSLKQTQPIDVIALWQVIEHLPDPWTALDAIAQHLQPGGFLILAAPNPAALQFRLLKKFWTHVDAPRHLELIPTQLLTEFMKKRGLKTVLTTTQDKGSLGWNRFGWAYSLANFSSRRVLKKGLHLLGHVISRVLHSLERKNGFGSTYTMIFKKEGSL